MLRPGCRSARYESGVVLRGNKDGSWGGQTDTFEGGRLAPRPHATRPSWLRNVARSPEVGVSMLCSSIAWMTTWGIEITPLARDVASCAFRRRCLGNAAPRPNQRCCARCSADDSCAVPAGWRRKPTPRTARWNHIGNIARILASGCTRGARRQHGCQPHFVPTRACADSRV